MLKPKEGVPNPKRLRNTALHVWPRRTREKASTEVKAEKCMDRFNKIVKK